MDRQSPLHTSASWSWSWSRTLAIGMLSAVVLLSMLACGIGPSGSGSDTGSGDTDAPPPAITPVTPQSASADDQVATSVALTVVALEQSREDAPEPPAPATPVSQPPAPGYAETAPPGAPPTATGGCGSATVGVCDVASVMEVDTLSVRAAPARDAPYLGEVPNGHMVDVLCLDEVEADGRTWVCVSTGSGGGSSTVGWMSTNYLAFGMPEAPTLPVCDGATVVEVAALSMQQAPTLDADPMGEAVPHGERVDILCGDMVEADGITWAHVRRGTVEGWMSTRYLLFDSVAAEPPPTPSGGCGSATVGMCDAAMVSGVDALSVRAEPARDAPYLSEVPNGRTVDVLCLDEVEADGRTWVCVSTGSGGGSSAVGWMSTDYLEFESAEAEPQAPPTPTGGCTSPTLGICGFATVSGVDALSVRAEPARDAPYLGETSNGNMVEVLCVGEVEADGRTWVCGVANSRTSESVVGWMSTNYLEFVTEDPADVEVCDRATVAGTDDIIIYYTPSLDSAIWGSYPEGTEVDLTCDATVKADGIVWARIHSTFNATPFTAWVDSDYLHFDPPDEPVTEVCNHATVVGVDELNIYVEPDLWADETGVTIQEGESVVVLCGDPVDEDGFEWIRVRAEHDGGYLIGWVNMAYLKFEFGSP